MPSSHPALLVSFPAAMETAGRSNTQEERFMSWFQRDFSPSWQGRHGSRIVIVEHDVGTVHIGTEYQGQKKYE